MIFFVEKMRGAFALQKLLTFFKKKYWHISDINVWNFNEMLTNDIVSFEQPGPDKKKRLPGQCLLISSLSGETRNKVGMARLAKPFLQISG